MSKTQKPAAAVAPSVDVSALHAAVIAALSARRDASPTSNMAKNFTTEIKLFRADFAKCAADYGIDVARLANRISVTDRNSNAYVAIYAMQKVRAIIAALFYGKSQFLDAFTLTMLTNMKANAGRLTNKSANVCLSRDVQYVETDVKQEITARHRCVSSTASTQSSSTRQALQALGMAHYDEVSREIILNDSAASQALLALV
jgi:hypothetical protein